MDALSKFLTPGITFLLTVAFGFWLSRVGKPYNGILFNIHKLIALGTVIITTLQAYDALKGMQPQALLIISIVFAVLCVVALFASGALMSLGKLDNQAMKTIHNTAVVLIVIAACSTIYLLAGNSL